MRSLFNEPERAAAEPLPAFANRPVGARRNTTSALFSSGVNCRGRISGSRLGLLAVTAFNPKKPKKFVLAKHWVNVQGLTEETLSITYWGKLHPGGISSALLFSFPIVRVFLLQSDR